MAFGRHCIRDDFICSASFIVCLSELDDYCGADLLGGIEGVIGDSFLFYFLARKYFTPAYGQRFVG